MAISVGCCALTTPKSQIVIKSQNFLDYQIKKVLSWDNTLRLYAITCIDMYSEICRVGIARRKYPWGACQPNREIYI